MEAATNSTTRHLFYHPKPTLSMSPKPIQAPVFRVVQLHMTYFKFYKENEDERKRDEVFKMDTFHCSPKFSAQSINADADTPTKKVLPPLTKYIADRSNKLNKGHLSLKWHFLLSCG
eukprot:jgi/Psemu1/28214/gm1.28214_g